jgi:hypothetical protein
MSNQDLIEKILLAFATRADFNDWLMRDMWPAFNQRQLVDRSIHAAQQLLPRSRHYHSGQSMSQVQFNKLKVDDHYWFIEDNGLWQLMQIEKQGRSKGGRTAHAGINPVPAQPCPFGEDPNLRLDPAVREALQRTAVRDQELRALRPKPAPIMACPRCDSGLPWIKCPCQWTPAEK